MKKYSCFLALVLLSSFYSHARIFNEQKLEQDSAFISFQSGSNVLNGHLYKPKNTNNASVIVILHSASEPSHLTPLYQHIKEALLGIGKAVFIYDRRASNLSFAEQALDAKSAIETLRKQPNIAHEKFSLLGISQGAWVAPVLYDMIPDLINSVILISMSGVSPAEQMKFGSAQTLKLENYNDSIIQLARSLRDINDAYYRGNIDRNTAQQKIDSYRSQPWFNFSFLPARGNLPADAASNGWKEAMDYDPITPIKKISAPLLFFYGSYDRWLPIDQSIKDIHQGMREIGKKDYEIFRLSSGGHMMTVDVVNSADTNFSTEFTGKLVSWLKKIK